MSGSGIQPALLFDEFGEFQPVLLLTLPESSDSDDSESEVSFV